MARQKKKFDMALRKRDELVDKQSKKLHELRATLLKEREKSLALEKQAAEKQKEEKEHQMTTLLQEGLGLTEKKGYELEAELDEKEREMQDERRQFQAKLDADREE